MNWTEKWTFVVFVVLMSLLSTSTSQSEKTNNRNSITTTMASTVKSVPPTEKASKLVPGNQRRIVDCSKLLPGQYICDKYPDIDNSTQQPRNCQRETGKAPKALRCQAAPGLICQRVNQSSVYEESDFDGVTQDEFYMDADCKWTNGYHFDTALLLSVFMGMFGADRFYLGYPALGLLKLSTLGFFFLGHLLDVILIATQVVGPADSSHYIISYFGAGVDILTTDNDTQRRPLPSWETSL